MNLTSTLGDGSKRRKLIPTDQSGSTDPLRASLMRVVSMAAGPDGSLYVGDFNLVRKVAKDGKAVETILQLQ